MPVTNANQNKKMDLYEEKPVLELSGGADGPRLWWVSVLYFAS